VIGGRSNITEGSGKTKKIVANISVIEWASLDKILSYKDIKVTKNVQKQDESLWNILEVANNGC
jgi:hypothetical protein